MSDISHTALRRLQGIFTDIFLHASIATNTFRKYKLRELTLPTLGTQSSTWTLTSSASIKGLFGKQSPLF